MNVVRDRGQVRDRIAIVSEGVSAVRSRGPPRVVDPGDARAGIGRPHPGPRRVVDRDLVSVGVLHERRVERSQVLLAAAQLAAHRPENYRRETNRSVQADAFSRCVFSLFAPVSHVVGVSHRAVLRVGGAHHVLAARSAPPARETWKRPVRPRVTTSPSYYVPELL